MHTYVTALIATMHTEYHYYFRHSELLSHIGNTQCFAYLYLDDILSVFRYLYYKYTILLRLRFTSFAL